MGERDIHIDRDIPVFEHPRGVAMYGDIVVTQPRSPYMATSRKSRDHVAGTTLSRRRTRYCTGRWTPDAGPTPDTANVSMTVPLSAITRTPSCSGDASIERK